MADSKILILVVAAKDLFKEKINKTQQLGIKYELELA